MSSLKAGKQVDQRSSKNTRYKVLSIVCATLLCYLCDTNTFANGAKCLYINTLDKQSVFPIGLHLASGGVSGALVMANDDGCTDIHVGIYNGMIGGVMGCSDGCQEGVRQVGIHAQGWGGFRYPNQGTVEKPTQTNPIPTKFPNPSYACACVRKSFSGGGGYRYLDYVGRV